MPDDVTSPSLSPDIINQVDWALDLYEKSFRENVKAYMRGGVVPTFEKPPEPEEYAGLTAGLSYAYRILSDPRPVEEGGFPDGLKLRASRHIRRWLTLRNKLLVGSSGKAADGEQA